MGEPKRQSDGSQGGSQEISVSRLSPVETVFAQDMLRELIIDYAIRNNAGGLSGRNVGVIRLLQKPWRISVSRVLATNHEPLYKLTASRENSLNGTSFVETNGKLLDQFVKLAKNRILEPFPTFRLKVMEEFFHLENYDSFYNFLLQCGQGLVELELFIPKGAGYLPCVFSNVNFPNLWKMTTTFTNQDLGASGDRVLEADVNVMLLLQTFLNKSTSLDELVFPFNSAVVPHGFQYMSLPPTITKLDLSCELENPQSEILGRSIVLLPNLTELELMVTGNLFSEGCLTNLLGNLRMTLRKLVFSGLVYPEPPNAVNMVAFPVMEKLEELVLNTVNLELVSDIREFGNIFPKLRFVELWTQTRKMFHKWTSDTDSKASEIQSVIVQLVDYTVPDDGESGYILPILLEDMQRIHCTFPNISSLSLYLSAERACGIQFLFLKMKQLTSLTLVVHDSELVLNADYWDSILTGIPAGIISAMREYKSFWKLMDFKYEELRPSIKLLSGLRTLMLKTCDTIQVDKGETSPSLISDVAFEFSLMKMNDLKILEFKGRFKVSMECTEAWKNLGRSIKYVPSS